MKRKETLDKFAIAAALQEIAALLEMKGGKDRFKARAYQTGARVISGLTEDIGDVVRSDRLTSLRGIGDALASQIKQLHLSGESSVLSGLRREFPPGIVELSGVPGLSIKKIRALHDALGITSIAELRAAAETAKIRNIKGFGAKTEQQLLETIADHRKRAKAEQRLHIHHAFRAAEQISNYLETTTNTAEIAIAGSLRRWKETVDTIRFVAKTTNPESLIKSFLKFPLIVNIEEQTKTSCKVKLADAAKVSLIATRPSDFPLTLFTETGAPAHVAKIQQIASGELKVKTPRRAPLKQRELSSDLTSEEDIYRRLGMQYIPPELREDEGEIEAAIAGKLPEDLVTEADIKGMVHCHTTYSDGIHTLEAMVRGAEEMGMKYITITDHSPTAIYANGREAGSI